MFEIMRTRGKPIKPRTTPFGRRLSDARKNAGLTQTQLGELLGLSQRAIAHWELGNTTPPLRPELIKALSKALDMTVDELVLGVPGSSLQSKPGPKGKLYLLFEEASKLPKSEQKQIATVVSALINQAKISA